MDNDSVMISSAPHIPVYRDLRLCYGQVLCIGNGV